MISLFKKGRGSGKIALKLSRSGVYSLLLTGCALEQDSPRGARQRTGPDVPRLSRAFSQSYMGFSSGTLLVLPYQGPYRAKKEP